MILRAPLSAISLTSGRPTCPTPWTAKLRPCSPAIPSCSRPASIAHSTPRAVEVDGFPLPPIDSGTQMANRVVVKTVAMSSGVTPTSSAVMYAPFNDVMNRPYSSNTILRSYANSGSLAITPLPPPHHSPASAFLYVIPRESRRASVKAAPTESYGIHRSPPAPCPRHVRWIPASWSTPVLGPTAPKTPSCASRSGESLIHWATSSSSGWDAVILPSFGTR
mmetsp:Transcript_19441/g.50561  ORF Transcript_19441/g.50561 Transcript_19441/m.50561 type:complete len:221 (-) Transcript_19441:101-763(-)